jgi:hypothetical protein
MFNSPQQLIQNKGRSLGDITKHTIFECSTILSFDIKKVSSYFDGKIHMKINISLENETNIIRQLRN